MIAELLCSLIAYLLFAPNLVALRGPLSHQTHFLACFKWLVSPHLTHRHPMSSLIRVWRRKRAAGALVVPVHLQLPQPFKTYPKFVFFAYVFSHSLPAFGVTVNQGERRGAGLLFRYDTPLSFSLLLPRHLLSARFSTYTRKVGYGSARPFFFSLHFLYPTFAHPLFILWIFGMTGGWYLDGITSKWGLPLCVFVCLCFRAF